MFRFYAKFLSHCNLGLVLYKEDLLWNEKSHPYANKFGIVKNIVHEFAHQNFGNLVSNKWWNYVWMKEGFATLFELIGTNLVRFAYLINL